MILTVFEKI